VLATTDLYAIVDLILLVAVTVAVNAHGLVHDHA
jgi:hypothetical protein